jgi:hypothetical protein
VTSDPFAGFKAQQRELWATFAPTATFTTQPAARLIAEYFADNTVRQRFVMTRASSR